MTKSTRPDRLAQAATNLEACEVSGHALLVSYPGSVYDLRPNIASVAAAMTAFNPDRPGEGSPMRPNLPRQPNEKFISVDIAE